MTIEQKLEALVKEMIATANGDLSMLLKFQGILAEAYHDIGNTPMKTVSFDKLARGGRR